MRCERASELMSLRLDGELPPAEGALLDGHLEGCPACRETWLAMQRLSTVFARAPLVAPPDDFTSQVMDRLAERRVRPGLVWGALLLLFGAGCLSLLGALQLIGVAGILVEVARQPGAVMRVMELLPSFFSIGLVLLRASWLFFSSFVSLLSPQVIALYLSLAVMLAATWLLVLCALRPSTRIIRAH